MICFHISPMKGSLWLFQYSKLLSFCVQSHAKPCASTFTTAAAEPEDKRTIDARMIPLNEQCEIDCIESVSYKCPPLNHSNLSNVSKRKFHNSSKVVQQSSATTSFLWSLRNLTSDMDWIDERVSWNYQCQKMNFQNLRLLSKTIPAHNDDWLVVGHDSLNSWITFQ